MTTTETKSSAQTTVARRVIRVDGTEEQLPHAITMRQALDLIGADTIDTVALKNLGVPLRVMLVDDVGMIDGKPINAKATALYHANTRPGNPHSIHGDVVVLFDEDFA